MAIAVWDYLNDRCGEQEGEMEAELTAIEKKLIASAVGQLNWAGRQCRYDLAYVSCLVQQLAGSGRPSAIKWLKLAVKRAREPVRFRVRNLGCALEDVVFISASDAAYGAMPGGGSQGGVLVMLAAPQVLDGEAPVCIVEGQSSKIQRIVRASMSAEVSSLATAFEHGDYVRAVFAELVDPGFRLDNCKLSACRWRHVLATDARTGYDALHSETLPSDRKIAIDIGVLRQAMLESSGSSFVRWVPGHEMPCDGLTKWQHKKALTTVMAEGTWALADNPHAQAIGKQAAAKKAAWRRQKKLQMEQPCI